MMERKNFLLPAQLLSRFVNYYNKTGLSLSETVRSSLDEFLKRQGF